MKKKCISLFTILLLVLTLIPVDAWAENEAVTLDLSNGSIVIFSDGYTVGDGKKVAATSQSYVITQTGTEATANTITVKDGADVTITLKNVNISTDKTAMSLGDKGSSDGDAPRATAVRLILEGTNSLTSGMNCAGVQTNQNVTLTISGTGSIEARGGENGAGIGGGGNGAQTWHSCGGVIVINGGTIYAYAGSYAAGIGDGDRTDDQTHESAKITISGGEVHAQAGAGDGSYRTDIGTSDNSEGQNYSFSSGDNGGAVIYADTYRDTAGKKEAQGVFFNSEATKGNVQGNPSISTDLKLKDGATLTIPAGASLGFNKGGSLTVPSNSTLVVRGTFPSPLTIEEGAIIEVAEDVTVPDAYKDKVTIIPGEWSDDADTSWYKEGETEFTLTTPAQLAGLAKLCNALDEAENNPFQGVTIKLGNDIDLSGMLWTPFAFEGDFDGQGHAITGMDIQVEDERDYLGFFSRLEYATVENFTLQGKIHGSYGYKAGGLAGKIDDCQVSGVVSKVDINFTSGASYVGGLVGDCDDSTIRDCSYEGAITTTDLGGPTIGGIVGDLDDANIVNGYSAGKINLTHNADEYHSGSNLGGIVGEADGAATILNSGSIIIFNIEKTAYISYIAGIVGDCDDSDVRINNCWFNGQLPNGLENVYGIVGDDYTDIVAHSYSNYSSNDTDGNHGTAITTMEALVKDLNEGASALRELYPDVGSIYAWLLDKNGVPTFKEPETIKREPTAKNPVFVVTHPDQASYAWQSSEILSSITNDTTNAWRCTNNIYQSTNHNDSTSSELSIEYNVKAGDEIAFRWKVSSEENYDKLSYSLKDSSEKEIASGVIDGEVDWATVEIPIETAGKYTLTVQYSKDEDVSEGSDCGWVDVSPNAWQTIEGATSSSLTSSQAGANLGKMVRCVATYPDSQKLTSAIIKAEKLYTVTFDAQGGSEVDSAYVGEGGYAIEPTAPEREGYTFTGWYSDEDLTQQWDFDADVIVKDITLYAGWKNNNPSIDIPSYTTTVPSVDNGSLSVSPRNARKGSTVTITVTPDEGYMIDTISATDKKGNDVVLTKTSDNIYTFTMPASKVEIAASFKKVEEPSPTILPFKDVVSGSWYEDAVRFVYEKGMMTGVSEDTFAPNKETSRGMLVTMLYRLEGEPNITGENLGYPFADVDATAYYSNAIYWARLHGIVSGMSDEIFAPNGDITREQLAAIMYRYAQYNGIDVSASADLSSFSDVASISPWAKDVLAWANAQGLIKGMGNNELAPQGQATRAQVAAIMERYCAMIEE